MNYGFQEQPAGDPNEEFMKRLKAMLNDTGFAGLRGLLSQLMVAPTTEGLSGGTAGGAFGGTPGSSPTPGSNPTGTPELSTSTGTGL